jgi:spore coat protein U-like protein
VRVKTMLRSSMVLIMLGFFSSAMATTLCSVTQVSALAFGPVLPLSGVVSTAEGEIRIRCEVVATAPLGNQVSVNIRISQGSSANFLQRKLSNSAGDTDAFQLNYNIFTQNSGETIWGDGSNGTSEVTVVVAGLSSAGAVREVNRSVYGRMPSFTNTKRAGQYRDSLIISINY